MTQAPTKFLAAFTYLVLTAVLATGGAQSAAPPIDLASNLSSEPSQAKQLFADAPDGVDPVVTGPVSAAFRERQAEAGCDDAVWPNVPLTCYPD